MSDYGMPMRPTLLRTTPVSAEVLRNIVAGNVRALWGRSRLNITDLARLLGCCQATASSRYHGRSAWRVDELEKVARLGAINVADLFEGEVSE